MFPTLDRQATVLRNCFSFGREDKTYAKQILGACKLLNDIVTFMDFLSDYCFFAFFFFFFCLIFYPSLLLLIFIFL